jgi:hypothetical protein
MSGLFTMFDYEWTKQCETQGFNQEFINEIYDMPEALFIQNVLDRTLPELPKLDIPEGTRFPVPTTLNTNDISKPPQLVRTLTQVPDTFHEWLYQFRFMLQYFTTEEMFKIYHLYDFAYPPNEPHAWVDEALEIMYVSSSSEDTEDTPENVEEFEFNLDWDIEKGNLRNSVSPKLSLFLPEVVGMREDENEEILKKI